MRQKLLLQCHGIVLYHPAAREKNCLCATGTCLMLSLAPSLHSQLFSHGGKSAFFLLRAKKSWEWRLGMRLPYASKNTVAPGNPILIFN